MTKEEWKIELKEALHIDAGHFEFRHGEPVLVVTEEDSEAETAELINDMFDFSGLED